MRPGNDLFLWPEFCLWLDARRNDTKRLPLFPVQPPRGLNREILPIPDSNLLWNRIWATLCLTGPRQLWILPFPSKPPANAGIACKPLAVSTRLLDSILRIRRGPSLAEFAPLC